MKLDSRPKNNNEKPFIIVFGGPTGTGKTALAIALAKSDKLPDMEIISADSRQIYRGMNIGTDKVSAQIQKIVPHHLIDIIDPDEKFSAADFLCRASRCIKDITARGKIPFVVGGTGLYIRVLTGGLASVAAPDHECRKKYHEYLKEHGESALHQILCKRDSKRASEIHPTDTFRVIRALEILDSGRENVSELLSDHGFEERPYRFLKCVLSVHRQKLYNRIEMRVDEMVNKGLLKEVMELRTLYDKDVPALNGIGYAQIGRYLDDEISLDEAIRIIKRDTRHYAKRQITWFKKEPETHFIQHDPDKLAASVTQMTDLILETL